MGLRDFPCITPHIPRIEDLREAAQRRISSDAKDIEDMVDQTSEFEEIDNLIASFETGMVLDEFVYQEVSSRLRVIKRLRVDKEVVTDILITEMIEKNDFS